MPLNPANIQYLAFEGGGGKGASYLGAIHVIEQLKKNTHTNGKLNDDPIFETLVRNVITKISSRWALTECGLTFKKRSS